MRLSWKKDGTYGYIGSNGASREYRIEIVIDGRSARGAANVRQDGRHLAAVGASSSTMDGAVTVVVGSLKRMCKNFEDTGAADEAEEEQVSAREALAAEDRHDEEAQDPLGMMAGLRALTPA